MEEAPEQPAPEKHEDASAPPRSPGRSRRKPPRPCARRPGRLAAHLEAKEPDSLDVAHTLINARALLEHRAVVVGSDKAELLGGLDALAQGKEHPALSGARALRHEKLAFVFGGQGSQWLGMAAELSEQVPAFAEQISRCEEALSPHLDFSLAATSSAEPTERPRWSGSRWSSPPSSR